jgi:hypothetical protein
MKTPKILCTALLASLLLAPCALCAQESAEDIEREILLLKKQKELKKAKRSAVAVEIPCQEYDDEQWYVGTGKARVRFDKLNTDEYTKLLKSCQQLLKSKIRGRYQAVVHDYFDQMDVDGQSRVSSHIESAGVQVIDRYLDDTRETCREETDEDEQGYVTVYMNVKISKHKLADAVAEGISKEIAKEAASENPQNRQMRVRYDEKKFRESALKVFEGKEKEEKDKKEASPQE